MVNRDPSGIQGGLAGVHDDVDRTGRIVGKEEVTDGQLRVFGFDGPGDGVKCRALRLRLGAMQAWIQQGIDLMVKPRILS